jgi:hypothetical protein
LTAKFFKNSDQATFYLEMYLGGFFRFATLLEMAEPGGTPPPPAPLCPQN